ncbi:hypothetical protein C095_00340 [Fusobacterium necrophorum subsp. funduliforme B35]|uniref:Uncharacterized protein n=1 Tax=Fusobacterium necrophorum subsp. funduliforme B35 TaxID=1226633 RepID=A0A0B4EZS1_9FUSO|nr:hypothetical protein C095_00340 [Fusobacterium necrophorum subsp. funduliforme B35]
MKKTYKKPIVVFTPKDEKIENLSVAHCGCGC